MKPSSKSANRSQLRSCQDLEPVKTNRKAALKSRRRLIIYSMIGFASNAALKMIVSEKPDD